MKLFIDIETVPGEEDYNNLSPDLKMCYDKKFAHELSNDGNNHDCFEDHYKAKAGLYAEFGKIVCVSMGRMDGTEIKIKSFCLDREYDLLLDVAAILHKATSLVAHNGKEFDYPWLCRRMIINGIELPPILQIQNLKPWEIKLEDTVELWKFGQFNYRCSLALMCAILGLDSPKSGMDGSQVGDVFYKEKNLQKIQTYCEGDIFALIAVYNKIKP